MMLLESTRIERVISLTLLFIESGQVTTTEAAELTGVSVRTIQRDFAEISRVLPIYPENGRWVYSPEEVEISPY